MFSFDVRLKNDSRTPYLVEERKIEYISDNRLNNPESVVELMTNAFQIGDLAEECVYMLALNVRSELIGVFLVSKGVATCCYVGNREIFIRALLVGAVNILMVHNHPSGDPVPSKEDLETTSGLVAAGRLLGINLTDHIVIGNQRQYCSIRMTYPEIFK